MKRRKFLVSMTPTFAGCSSLRSSDSPKQEDIDVAVNAADGPAWEERSFDVVVTNNGSSSIEIGINGYKGRAYIGQKNVTIGPGERESATFRYGPYTTVLGSNTKNEMNVELGGSTTETDGIVFEEVNLMYKAWIEVVEWYTQEIGATSVLTRIHNEGPDEIQRRATLDNPNGGLTVREFTLAPGESRELFLKLFESFDPDLVAITDLQPSVLQDGHFVVVIPEDGGARVENMSNTPRTVGLDEQAVTVPANGSVVVENAKPRITRISW